ncbi:MAG: DHHA1 domain-containing protein [Candidatus Pacearchaeota archaeon]
MIKQEILKELNNSLESSQNPMFFFDNDPDGLCSTMILQRKIRRGNAFPVKGSPLNDGYMEKIEQNDPDCIFVLDVPVINQSFFDAIEQKNIPLVWIDHHKASEEEVKEMPKFVEYINPFRDYSGPSATTYISYMVSREEKDLWLGVVGCIADRFLPDYYDKFRELYPDLAINSKDPFEIYYNSEIGKLAQMLNHGLKDRTSNVMKMLSFLKKAKSPYEVLEEKEENLEMHQKYREVVKRYEKIISKAKEEIDESADLIFFEYGGDTSMSSEISNRLQYKNPEKVIFVAYISNESFANVSGRGKNVKKILETAFEEASFEDSSGGGHDQAVGAKIRKEDLEDFKEKVREISERLKRNQ